MTYERIEAKVAVVQGGGSGLPDPTGQDDKAIVIKNELPYYDYINIGLAAMTSTDPIGGFAEDDRYYNTTDRHIYTYNGGEWSDTGNPVRGRFYFYNSVLYYWDGSDLKVLLGGAEAAGNQWPALSMLIMPCALTGADALGWTPQGGQVTNAMSPQLYQRILTEYNASADTTDSVVVSNVGGTDVTVDIPCRISASSGLKIVDVSGRAAVDNLYAQTGSAFYIVLDQANAVFYLPRFTDGATFTGDVGQVGLYGKDQIVNITGSANLAPDYGLYNYNSAVLTGAFKKGGSMPYSAAGTPGAPGGPIVLDTSQVVNTGDRVQGRNVKLFVYFRTGDHVINGQDIDFGEVQAALNLKANSDLSNVANRHVIETWLSSDKLSWYTLYSDGWIEQGGEYQKAAMSISTETLTFPRQFTDASTIKISLTLRYPAATGGTAIQVVGNPTLINMIIGMTAATWQYCYWEAKGY